MLKVPLLAIMFVEEVLDGGFGVEDLAIELNEGDAAVVAPLLERAAADVQVVRQLVVGVVTLAIEGCFVTLDDCCDALLNLVQRYEEVLDLWLSCRDDFTHSLYFLRLLIRFSTSDGR